MGDIDNVERLREGVKIYPEWSPTAYYCDDANEVMERAASEITYLRSLLTAAYDRADRAEAEVERMRPALGEAQAFLDRLSRPKEEKRTPSGTEILSLWAEAIAVERKCRAALEAEAGKETT